MGGRIYNPFPNIDELKEHLFAENWDDVWLLADGPMPALTHRDYVVESLLNAAKRVWNMRFRTAEEWDNQPCPQCGSTLCVD